MQRALVRPTRSTTPPAAASALLLLCLAKARGEQIALFGRPKPASAAPATTTAAVAPAPRLTPDERKGLLDAARALLRSATATRSQLEEAHRSLPTDSDKMRAVKDALHQRLQADPAAGAAAVAKPTQAPSAPPAAAEPQVPADPSPAPFPAPAAVAPPEPATSPQVPAPAPAGLVEAPEGVWRETAGAYAARVGARPPPADDLAARATMTGRQRREHDEARATLYARHDAAIKDWHRQVTEALDSGVIHPLMAGLSRTAGPDRGARDLAVAHAARRAVEIVNNHSEALFREHATHPWSPGDVAQRHLGEPIKVASIAGDMVRGVTLDGAQEVNVHRSGLRPMTAEQARAEVHRRAGAELRGLGLPPAALLALAHEHAYPDTDPKHLRLPGGPAQRPAGAGWEVIPGTTRGGWHRRRQGGGWERWYPDTGLAVDPLAVAPLDPDATGPTRPAQATKPGRPGVEIAPGVFDTSGRKTHHDVGEVVDRARKHQAQRVSAGNLGEVEAEGEASASQRVTKAAVLGEVSPLLDREKGCTAGAAALKAYVRSLIAGKPTGEGRDARHAYVHGLEWVGEGLDQCQTVRELRGFIEDLGWLSSEGRSFVEEYPTTPETLRELADRFPDVGNRSHRVMRLPGGVVVNLTAMRAAGLAFGEATYRKLAEEPAPYRGWVEALGPRFSAAVLRNGSREQNQRWRQEVREAEQRERTSDWSGLVEAPLTEEQREAADAARANMRSGTVEGDDGKKATYYEIVRMRRQGPRLRVGGAPVPENATGADLMRTFGLRAVQYGNWVSDDEAQSHLLACYGALHDLADVLGVPPDMIAKGSRLAIAFGARGKGKGGAHYELDRAVINLTSTQGGGLLAHEFAHFLDHQLAGGERQMLTDVPGAAPELQRAMQDLLVAMRGPEQLADSAERLRRWRSDLKRRRQRAVSNHESMAPLDREGERYAVAVAAYNRQVRSGQKPGPPTSFYIEAARLGGDHAARDEMFARAFESYVEDRLVRDGRLNTYLVTGTRVKGRPGEPEPYPQGEERTRIAAAFDHLLDVVRSSGALAKALGDTLQPLQEHHAMTQAPLSGSVTMREALRGVVVELLKAKTWTRSGAEQATLFVAPRAAPAPAPAPSAPAGAGGTHVVHIKEHVRHDATGSHVVQAHDVRRPGPAPQPVHAHVQPHAEADEDDVSAEDRAEIEGTLRQLVTPAAIAHHVPMEGHGTIASEDVAARVYAGFGIDSAYVRRETQRHVERHIGDMLAGGGLRRVHENRSDGGLLVRPASPSLRELRRTTASMRQWNGMRDVTPELKASYAKALAEHEVAMQAHRASAPSEAETAEIELARRHHETARARLAKLPDSVLTGDHAPIAKVTGRQATMAHGRAGLALVPSATNPQIRRWQRMGAEDAATQGHPTLRGIIAAAEGHAARLGPEAHLGGGTYMADMDAPLRTLQSFERHHADTIARTPEARLSPAQRRTAEHAAGLATTLHQLNQRAAIYRPAPSVEQVGAMDPARLANVAVAARRMSDGTADDPWAKAGARASELLRPKTAEHPDQDTPAARLAAATQQAQAVLSALPASLHLPSAGHAAGDVLKHLEDVEAHAHRLVWHPEQGTAHAARSEAKLAEIRRVMDEARTARRAPARLDLLTMSSGDLLNLAHDADALRSPKGGDEWTLAQNAARRELQLREGPAAVVVEARRKELEESFNPRGDLDMHNRKAARGLTRPDAVLDAAVEREELRRELLAAGRRDDAQRLFGSVRLPGGGAR